MVEIYTAVALPALATLLAFLLPSRLGRGLLVPPLVAAAATFGLLLSLRAVARGDAHSWRVPWLPSLGLDFVLTVDSLSLFFGLVVTGVGMAIAAYAMSYFDADEPRLKRFAGAFSFFMSSMLGCVLSGNLLQLFIFWELTGVASFLLIGLKHEKENSRTGARLAFLLTSVTGLCLFGGVLLLGMGAGTFEIGELLAAGTRIFGALPYPKLTFALLALGAFGKSAQFPFFFWLPRAMSAPTPVSAYLHSAALVKLGVFFVGRLYPVLSGSPDFMPVFAAAGSATLVIGGIAALFARDLKAALAYSTISHLGLFFAFYGTAPGRPAWEGLQILAHVLYKAPLFMTAGYIEHLTGTRDLRSLSGLLPRAPLAAIITALGCASMVAFPTSLGGVAKDLLVSDLKSAWPSAWPSVFLGALLLAAAFKVALSLRLLISIFGGPEMKASEDAGGHPRASNSMLMPALVLSVLGLVVGLMPTLSVWGFLPGGVPVETPPWLKSLPTTGGALAVGLIIYFFLGRAEGLKRFDSPRILLWDRPLDRFFDKFPYLARHVADAAATDRPALFLPIILGALIVGLGLALGPLVSEAGLFEGFSPGPSSRWMVTLLAAVAALVPLFVERLLARVIALSVHGFLLVTLFVYYRAPDLAMTQLLVEAVSFLLLLYLIGRLRESDPLIPGFSAPGPVRRALNLALSAGFGVLASLAALVALQGAPATKLGKFFLETTLPLAHGGNAVNTVLVDYRGFDTLGEITVLVAASLGLFGLWSDRLRAPRRRAASESPLFRLAALPIVILMALVAGYMHLRGHNQPGGGFIAGLVASLALVVWGVAQGSENLWRRMRVRPEALCALGLALAWISAVGPVFFGRIFFEHAYGPWGLSTALVFDTGVFFVVVGMAARIALAILPHAPEVQDGPA